MHEITGNTQGLKKSALEALQKLYDISVPSWQVASEELLFKMAEIRCQAEEDVLVYLSRRGAVVCVGVDSEIADLEDLPDVETRKGRGRLSGIRCLVARSAKESGLTDKDTFALLKNRYDVIACCSIDETTATVRDVTYAAICGMAPNGKYLSEEFDPLTAEEFCELYLPNMAVTAEKLLSESGSQQNEEKRAERVMLVSLETGKTSGKWSTEDSLEELRQLAKTAGAEVVGKFMQKRPKPDPAYFIGRGKVRELADYARQEDIDTCIFDEELSPAQGRNLERGMGIKVLDRTALILDIFAQRAQTNEGKLQVELAQLKYNLPRIAGKGTSLSRLGGGIGTRGPGEKKIETDRRIIHDRIAYINKCLEKVVNVRTLHRNKRTKNNVFAISLVGYTNSGKSTLLNTLTGSDIYAQDQLFATLDPTTRQLDLPDKQQALLTDTVGFIQRLPHQLVSAFKSTLEEIKEADLLLHVIDYSHPMSSAQHDTVCEVLKEIGAGEIPVIQVYNKIDKLEDAEGLDERSGDADTPCVYISAKYKKNIDKLLETISANLKLMMVDMDLLIPYADSDAVAKIYKAGTVMSCDYLENGTRLKARLDVAEAAKWEKYTIKG